MYQKVLIFLCAINHCLGQSFNSPPLDWTQTDGTGAYRFGYATGDEGRHYHVSSATADNTVAGRFGDPETGGDLQTTYTAGRRGFRARGPHIARRMDLSQNSPPFSRPNDDGQYHPELDNYFDPNEDRGYDFSYRTSNHIKEEHADRVGDVQGRYSYLDDIGIRHNVDYIAGSKTGFVVTNPVPDTFAQARGGPLYFVGKGGGSKIRGYSAVQKNINGAYRFLASGPDHKRSEISDSAGNRRGVYTYLDDKGVQHTVEYIAGPRIGYKVINNKKGVSYNPVLPFFPDSSTVQPLFSSSTGGGSGGSKPLSPVPSTPTPLPPGGGDLFTPLSPSSDAGFPSGGGNGQLLPLPPSSSITSALSKPSKNKTPTHSSSGRPSTSSQPPISSDRDLPFSFEPSGDFPSVPPASPSTSSFSIPAKPQRPGNIEDSAQKWNYDFDYFFNSPSDLNKDWSKPLNRPSGTKVTSTPKSPTFESLPDLFSSTPFPDPSFLASNSFNEGLNTAESGNSFKPPIGNKRKEICAENDSSSLTKNGEDGSSRPPKDRNNQNNFSGSSLESASKDTINSWEKHYYKGHKSLLYPSRGTVKFGIGAKKNEWHKTSKEEGYFAIPPGVAVRAHVQSLDIVPFKRFESPEEALKHHDDKSQTSN